MKGCLGRASLDLETNQFTITSPHNEHHQVTDEKVEVLN